jgi:GMP synthase (glutamine-hydrolysing)
MKPILIVKLGSTIPSLAESHGDFEDWIEARLRLAPGHVAVIDPQRAPLPEPRHFSGVILTGSHSMVTDHEPWSERTAGWIRTVMETQTPLLGICYGDELIAYALGGEVGPNPRGHESGTVEIMLRDKARADPLFAALTTTFRAHVSHAQSVLRLPPGATWLGFNSHDPPHAYTVGRSTWCVQVHPEFDEFAMRTYIDVCAEEQRIQEDAPAQLRESIAETPHSEELLRRFAAIAGGGDPAACGRQSILDGNALR